MTSRHIRVERRDAAVWLFLDRPPLNVMDIDMLDELEDSLAEASSAPDVAVVVLTGSGRAFCAGVDVADHTGDRLGRMMDSFRGVIDRLLCMEPPVIAAVNGAALGGGCELLLASDMVVASERAKFGQPEIRLGVFPPAAAALLPSLIGRQRALDLILTGRMISAEEALMLGLVSRVLPADGFESALESLVGGVASLSPRVLRLAKRATATASGAMQDALTVAERMYVDELMLLRDAHEGLEAFMEKRQPVWEAV